MTINEVMLQYLDHAEVYYVKKDGTTTSELSCIREAARRLRKLYGSTQSREFGPKALKAVRQHMIGEGLSRGVMNGYVDRIKRLFKWAVAEELVPSAVFHGLQAVDGLKRGRSAARETAAVKPVSQAAIDAILPHVAPQVAAMIQFQLLTGCRPGEACILRGSDIELTGRVWIFRPKEHKTEHHDMTREIFIGPRAQKVIKPWLRMEIDARLFQPCEAEEARNEDRRKNRKSPMTPSQAARKPKRQPRRTAGGRYGVTAYRRAITRGCEIAFGMPEELRKIPKKTTQPQKAELAAQASTWRKEHCWHPHQLRHNAGTNLRKEFGVELARIILGHATAFTTEIYAEADRQQAMEVIAKVG